MANERELAALRHRIEVTRRVIASPPAGDEDVVTHEMIVDELEEQLPKLERRANWLAAHRRGTRQCRR